MIASSGAAYADDHQNVQLVYRGGVPGAIRAGEGDRTLIALVQHFVTAIDGGYDVATTVADWRTAMSVVATAQTSASRKEALPMSEPVERA